MSGKYGFVKQYCKNEVANAAQINKAGNYSEFFALFPAMNLSNGDEFTENTNFFLLKYSH